MRTSTLIIASGSAEGSISVCDLRNGETTTSLKGNFAPNGICVLGSESVAAAQADRQTVQFFSARDHAQQRALVAETLAVLTATADGQYLAGGAGSGTIYLWEVSSGRLLRTWPAHYKGVTALLFVGGASLLLSGGEDTLVHGWLLADLLDPLLDLDRAAPTAAQPKPLNSWCDHTLQVTALVAGAGEAAAVLASASLDRTVKLRRLADGCLLRSLAFPTAINDIAMDAGEETLYAAGADGIVYAAALGADTSTLGAGADAATAATGAAGLVDTSDGNGYQAFVGHSRPVTCLTLASLDLGLGRSGAEAQYRHGDVLISGAEDGTVRVWDLYSRQAVQVITTSGKAPVKSILTLSCLALGGVSHSSAHSSSHGAQPRAPLSKYTGQGQRWLGAPIRVDGSEALPRGGLLRLSARQSVSEAFALGLAGPSPALGPLLRPGVEPTTESVECAWLAVLANC